MRREKRRKLLRNFSLLRCGHSSLPQGVENFGKFCTRPVATAVAQHIQFSTLWDVPKSSLFDTENNFVLKKENSPSHSSCVETQRGCCGTLDVTHRKRQFSFDGGFPAAIYVSRWELPANDAGKSPHNNAVLRRLANIFIFLLAASLTQHLFLVGHGRNIRGVLSREIKSVISEGKQAFW